MSSNINYDNLVKLNTIANLSEIVNNCVSKDLFKSHIQKYYKNYINYLRCINRCIISTHAFPFDKTNMITTIFKVIQKDENGEGETSSIYSCLFSRWETINKSGPFDEKPHNQKLYDRAYVHKYACMSPTFTSQDGEFRHRFNKFDLLIQLKNSYADVYNAIEEHINAQMNSGLSFYCEFFYPKQLISNKEEFEEQVNRERLAILLYSNAWLCDFYNFMTKATENHMNVAYAHIILDPSGEELFNKLVDICIKYDDPNRDNISVDNNTLLVNNNSVDNISVVKQNLPANKRGLKNLKHLINQINTVNLPSVSLSNPRLRSVEFGQKIIPMHINEASNLYNIRYGVWRELYISQLCADLVVNHISPSFPLVESWFLIQNSRASLFDNISMYDKHTNAKLAHGIGIELIDLNLNNFISKNKNKGYINDRFFKLSNKFINAVNFIEEKLDLSNISICFQMEYLGRTWKDMPYLSRNVERRQITDLFNSYNVFAKIMFDFVYALLCMNVKLGILHGDLHLNNATFYKIFDLDKAGEKLDNPLTVYIINDGKHEKTYFNTNTIITQNISKFNEKSPSITIPVEDYVDGGAIFENNVVHFQKSDNNILGGGLEDFESPIILNENPAVASQTFNENLESTLAHIIETEDSNDDSEYEETTELISNLDSLTETREEDFANEIKYYDGSAEKNTRSRETAKMANKMPEIKRSDAIDEEFYIFGTNGTFGCIIDFSRSIIGNLDKIVAEFGYMVASKFKKEQRIRALQIIKNNFPKFYEKNENSILVLSIENFAILFKILSAIDIYSLSKNTYNNLSNMKNSDNMRDFTYNKDIENLIYYIQTLSEKYILSNLQLAFERKITKPDEIEWPNLVIIREAFSKYRYNTEKLRSVRGEIIDIYNFTNNIEYSTRSQSQYPPYLDYDEIRKMRLSCGLEDPDFIIESLKSRPTMNEVANESLELNMILDIDHLNKNTLSATISSP